MAPSTGRRGDTNGDGTVTATDAVGIWLMGGNSNPRTNLQAALVDAQGSVVWKREGGQGSTFSTLGALPALGTSAIDFLRTCDIQSYASAVSEGTTLYARSLGDQYCATISLVDLDENGTPELLSSGYAVDAATGSVVYEFPGQAGRPVAADLDLDGHPEILTIADGKPLIVHVLDGHTDVCPVSVETADNPGGNASFAIGDLDGDGKGEFVVANASTVAICRSDGTLVAATTVPLLSTDGIGLAQLDDDAASEIVLGQLVPTDPLVTVLMALDTDFSPLWTTEIVPYGSHLPFSIADLDGDGRHEIIARSDHALFIVSPDGVILAQAHLNDVNAGTWANPPVITDLDHDGRAEILVGGLNPSLTVLDNAEGGWPVRGAEEWWPGLDHFPGDRAMDGTLPSGAATPWLEANVWQGLAAGAPDLPDLGVEAQACSESCETTVITAWVSNQGRADDPMPVTVEVARRDGTVLGSETLPSVASGVSTPVEFIVPTSEIWGNLVVRATGSWAECTDVPNEVVLTNLPCR